MSFSDRTRYGTTTRDIPATVTRLTIPAGSRVVVRPGSGDSGYWIHTPEGTANVYVELSAVRLDDEYAVERGFGYGVHPDGTFVLPPVPQPTLARPAARCAARAARSAAPTRCSEADLNLGVAETVGCRLQ